MRNYSEAIGSVEKCDNLNKWPPDHGHVDVQFRTRTILNFCERKYKTTLVISLQVYILLSYHHLPFPFPHTLVASIKWVSPTTLYCS